MAGRFVSYSWPSSECPIEFVELKAGFLICSLLTLMINKMDRNQKRVSWNYRLFGLNCSGHTTERFNVDFPLIYAGLNYIVVSWDPFSPQLTNSMVKRLKIYNTDAVKSSMCPQSKYVNNLRHVMGLDFTFVCSIHNVLHISKIEFSTLYNKIHAIIPMLHCMLTAYDTHTQWMCLHSCKQ